MVLGIVVIVLGVTCNAIGVGLAVNPKDGNDSGAGIFWIVFSLAAMIVPGVLLVLAGRRQAQRLLRLDKISALAAASERIPFAQLAVDLGVSQTAARDLLLVAINERRVAGRLDLEHGVFISATTHAGVQQLTMTCKGCGGRSTVVVTAHSTSHCQYCGFRLA